MVLDKKLYKAIKNKNRKEMKEHLENIYKIGFRAGVEAGDNADFRIKLLNVLHNTKGIGPKLIERILETVKEEER